MSELIYPEVRRLLPDLEDDILESYEEHHVADVLLGKFAALSSDADRFDAKTTVRLGASLATLTKSRTGSGKGRRAGRADHPAGANGGFGDTSGTRVTRWRTCGRTRW